MHNLKVTLVQADQHWEDKEANYRNYERLLSNLVPTDVILLPEMFNTGFSMNTSVLAEEMENSSAINWLKNLAAEKKAAIYTSLIIQEGENYFNRGVFVDPNGTVIHYDKRKTFGLAKEDQYYQSGKNAAIVEYKDWKIMLQICYDLRFPEIVRNQLDQDGTPIYDVIFYVANWPSTRQVHWSTLLQARAIENQCYVVGVNRVGTAPTNLSYSGNSKVVDVLGNVKELDPSKELIETITLDGEALKETRQKLPFLKDAQF